MNEYSQEQSEVFDEAVSEALGDDPRAAELRRMTALLQERRARLEEDFAATGDEAERATLKKKLQSLDEQIGALAEEAAITQFVEDAVRVGIEMRRLQN